MITHIEYATIYCPTGLVCSGCRYCEEARERDNRIGYIWKLRVPLSVASKLIGWEIRLRYAWKKRFHPLELHPQDLYGYDGEPPYFLRADLAADRGEVFDWWAAQWGWDTALEALGYLEPVAEIDQVWMLDRTDDSYEAEEGGWYDVVPEGTQGAILYWRWSE